MQFDQIQEQAIKLATTFDTQHRIVAITGQAGTGKTTIMKRVYELAAGAGFKVALCAPTGKAAKRITEATGCRAITVHRLLKFGKPSDIDPKTGRPIGKTVPAHGPEYPVPYDLILCDEYAMVTKELHRYILAAMPHMGYLRVFGDINQLPPIEDDETSSSVFAELLQSKPSLRLTTIHRQSGDSNIPVQLDTILKGRIPTNTGDFQVINDISPLRILKQLVDQDRTGWASLDRQLIVAMRQRFCGSTHLSQLIQNIVNPPTKTSLELPRHKWDSHAKIRVSPGDKIIWTENDYEVEAFNGETGIVLSWTDDHLDLDFGDRKLSVPRLVSLARPWNHIVYSPWRSVSLAYAITTHKSQGSEWQNVTYLMDRAAASMQTKNNLYTACSRGRQNVTIISDYTSLQTAVARLGTKKS